MPSRKRRQLYPNGESIQSLFDLTPCQRPTFCLTQDYLTDIAEKMAACGLTDRGLYKSITFLSCDFSSVAIFPQLRFFLSYDFSSVAIFPQLLFFLSCDFSSVAIFPQLRFFLSCDFSTVAIFPQLQFFLSCDFS